MVSLDDTSPNGDGSIRKYFCGEETGDIIGAHLLLLGEAGFISGSKSRVLFRVAPQAITPNGLQKSKIVILKCLCYVGKSMTWAGSVLLILAYVS